MAFVNQPDKRPPASALPTPNTPPLDRARMEQAISARARRFSLGALLDALRATGYADDQILFRSHATNAHQSSVVYAVYFSNSPLPRATVVLNLGLLAPQSLLPSYFRTVLDAQFESGLSDFLGFFAHRLLRGSVQGQYPEREAAFFPAWQSTLAQLRSLLGVRALSTVHWIFALSYPELAVSVQRISMLRPVRTRGVRVGPWALGDGAVLGAVAQVPVAGIAVKLLSDEPMTHCGVPWAREAGERLEKRVFPALTRHGIHLQVSLVLRDQKNFFVLRPNQFLGYSPIYGGPQTAKPTRSARTIILWNDEVPTI